MSDYIPEGKLDPSTFQSVMDAADVKYCLAKVSGYLFSSLDAVRSSGILKAKQKLGVTFNFDKQDVIDLTKFSKMTMCRASEANS